MITKHKLAERIKKMREDRELSQEELATKLGVPRPSISQIESGQRDVSSIELAKIAKIFEISMDDLLSPDLDGKDVGRFGDPTHVHGVVITTSKHRGASRGAQRRRVELIETQTLARHTIECGSWHRTTEGRTGAKADVVQQNQDDVGRSFRSTGDR